MSERLQIISEELSKSVRSANDFLQLKSPNHDGIKKIHNEWINPNNEELLIPERLIDPEKSISFSHIEESAEYGDRLLHENTQLENPKRTAAIQSGLAVCKVRLGRIQGIQSTIFSGLMNQSQANRAMFNKERTITLAKWAIDSGIRDKRGGFNYQRLGNIILGTEMLLESLFRS